MSTATRWYCTREAVKAAVTNAGPASNALIDSYIEAASEKIESEFHRRFIPETATKLYRWPEAVQGNAVLYLDDDDLLAVTTLKTDAQAASPITIASTDYYLEPINKPPYHAVEIDAASSAVFQSGASPQRSISILGRWAYSETTKAAGALAEADDGTETALDVTDSSLIGVGDTILIGTEALFVSEKALLDTTANTAGALTATKSETTVPVNTGTLVKAGEVITIDSERMFVESISGNNLTVERAYDGSVLAAHSNPSDVYAPRTLTVVRAVNGTTAAAHSLSDAIVKYAPPADIVDLCRAEAIARYEQGRAGWTGQLGGGESAVEIRPFGLIGMWKAAAKKYRRLVAA